MRSERHSFADAVWHLEEPVRDIYRGAIFRIGVFRCPVDHPRFRFTGPPRDHLVVFPRTAVEIVHDGRRPVLADPSTVMMYNRHQKYRREKVSELGDRCDFFGFDDPMVAEVVRARDPAVDADPEHPFRWTHGPSREPVYLAQRLLVEHVLRCERDGSEPDRMWVDETGLRVLERVVADTAGHPRPPRPRRRSTAIAHRGLVERTRLELARNMHDAVSIAEIADRVGASPYHLCRVFRSETGCTLHAHLTGLRLRRALELMADAGNKLASVGMAVGFAHHSHFTASFRRRFGVTPSQAREAGPSAVRDLIDRLLGDRSE